MSTVTSHATTSPSSLVPARAPRARRAVEPTLVRDGASSSIKFALFDAANQANAAMISGPASRVRVAVQPTNEEWVAALQAERLIRSSARKAA